MALSHTKKLSTIFTLAAGITAGSIIGVGSLYQDYTQTAAPDAVVAPADTAPVRTPRITTPAARLPVSAEVTAVNGNVLHVRAHTWVAQFTAASVCPTGTAEPETPCRYEAHITDATGNVLTNIRAGQKVYLADLREVDAGAPPAISTAMPSIRPRQDRVVGPVAATVLKTGDGDTVQVLADIWPGTQVLIDIRIGDIDTPEKKGRAKCTHEAELAAQATAATQALVEGKAVTLHNIQYEKYGGRLLADVQTLQGVSVATNLIDQGLARPYDGGTKKSWCTMAHK